MEGRRKSVVLFLSPKPATLPATLEKYLKKKKTGILDEWKFGSKLTSSRYPRKDQSSVFWCPRDIWAAFFDDRVFFPILVVFFLCRFPSESLCAPCFPNEIKKSNNKAIKVFSFVIYILYTGEVFHLYRSKSDIQ